MEIALNMLQPMGTETMPAVAGTAAVPASQAPNGAFALFFAQMLETMPAPASELQQPIREQKMTAVQKEGMPVQETESTEKELPTELAVELQAASLMPLAPQPVPVTTVPAQPEREVGPVPVESVSINVVPEAEPTVAAATLTPASPVSVSGDAPADRPLSLTPTEMSQVQPAAENNAPVKEEHNSVKAPAALPQNEVRLASKERHAPTPPMGEVEAAPTVPQASTSTPMPAAEDVVEPQKVVIKTVAAEAAISTSQRTLKPAAEAKLPDQEPRIEETAESAVTTGEKPVTLVAKDADLSGSNGEGPQEQRLAPHVKEILPHPVTTATESLREPEPVRQAQAPAATTPPATEHEHIMLQVKEKLSVHSVRPGNDQISFTLHPEELGELKIMMRMDDQRLKVEIITQNNTVREALMQNLDGLRESLSRQSITVDRFDVSTGGGSFNQAFNEGRHAGRDRVFQPYPQFGGSMKEPEQKTIVTGWLPREDSLVDVRF